MPPDQKASQMRSIWLRMSPVSMGQFLCVVHQPPWARGVYHPHVEGQRLVYGRAGLVGRTMSLLVLSTRAKISLCSALGTAK